MTVSRSEKVSPSAFPLPLLQTTTPFQRLAISTLTVQIVNPFTGADADLDDIFLIRDLSEDYQAKLILSRGNLPQV